MRPDCTAQSSLQKKLRFARAKLVCFFCIQFAYPLHSICIPFAFILRFFSGMTSLTKRVVSVAREMCVCGPDGDNQPTFHKEERRKGRWQVYGRECRTFSLNRSHSVEVLRLYEQHKPAMPIAKKKSASTHVCELHSKIRSRLHPKTSQAQQSAARACRHLGRPRGSHRRQCCAVTFRQEA